MDGGEKETAPPSTVVLVHGLWMTGREMRLLGRRLGRCGFGVRYFRYPSWRGSFDGAVEDLRSFVESVGGERVHLVGHSLGGVLIVRMMERPPANAGAFVLLGSPVRGSRVARRVARCGPGRFILGRMAREGIVEHPPSWPYGTEPLVIAGTFPLGTGLLFGLPRPHDGVIRVDETRVGTAEPFPVRTSHFGMLLSRSVAEEICRFFRSAAR